MTPTTRANHKRGCVRLSTAPSASTRDPCGVLRLGAAVRPLRYGTMNARASGNASQRPAPFTESAVVLLAAKPRPLICCDRLRCRPRAIPLRLDVNPLRGDRDHDAFAVWVLSSSERAVFNSSLRMSQKGRALPHSGDGRDRTPTCDLWHVRVVVLVMPKKVEENHGIPGRNQS